MFAFNSKKQFVIAHCIAYNEICLLFAVCKSCAFDAHDIAENVFPWENIQKTSDDIVTDC